MKIAHIVCVFPPYRGGIGNVVFKYAEEQSKLGESVTVFFPDYNGCQQKSAGFNCVALRPLLQYGNGAFLPQLFWRTASFDIIHLHYPFFGGAEPVWLRKIIFSKQTKLFIHYHMDIEKLPLIAQMLSWPANLIRSSLFNSAEAITCASLDYIKNSQIADIFIKSSAKFYEVPFGVDLNRFKPDEKWQIKKNVILFVGSLDKAHNFKGLDNLLSAMAQIKNKESSLIVVGSGNLLNYYQQLAQKKGISDRVFFAGSVDDKSLPIYYNKADLLVLPSVNKHEAFGLVLLEALASGIPLIASDLPGVRTVFSNEVEGLLVKANNVDDLTVKIDTVLANEDNWQKMCRAARALAENKYSWQKNINKINNLYQKFSGK